MDVRNIATLLVALAIFAILPCSSARAYDEYSHEWITRSAFEYMNSNPLAYPEAQKWTRDLGSNEALLENLLVRAVVDTDYHSDVWISAVFHDQIDGGETGGLVAMFTTMFHFLTVIEPGQYWEYDGYSYENSTKNGDDSYLNEPTVSLDGNESVPLGGTAPAGHAIHGANIGVYNLGFRGDARRWISLFNGSASNAVFPPSYVPAELAYKSLLSSPRAPATTTDSWSETQHLVTGAFGNTDLNRSYWRAELTGLPQDIDLLGMVMHLVQDTTVPHHVEDTSDRCHSEYERAVDQLTCATNSDLDYSKYYDGSYGDNGPKCDALYDPKLVNRILATQNLLDPAYPVSIRDRMVQSALLASQWDWRITLDKNYGTLLPNGALFSGDNCQDILAQEAVQEQAKYQFNFAIAETVAIFESAAHDYETQHAGEAAPPALSLSWFRATP